MTNEERSVYFRELNRRMNRRDNIRRALQSDNTRLNNQRRIIAAQMSVPVHCVIITRRGDDFMFTIKERK